MKVPLVGAEIVQQLLRVLESRGQGDDGTQALVTVLEGLAGTTVTRERRHAPHA